MSNSKKEVILNVYMAFLLGLLLLINIIPIYITGSDGMENSIDSIYDISSEFDINSFMNDEGTRASALIDGTSQWDVQVLASYNTKTSGCTIGDLDKTRAGNEIVTVNGDGQVAMVYKTNTGSWESITLWQGKGELITPVIADFYPDNPGNELVVVGMAIGPEADTGAGQATMIYGSGSTWKSAVIYLATNMLHGVAVGDLDPNHEGNEVITMSFGFDVEMLTWNGSGPTDWTVKPIWKAQGKVRKGFIDDIDPKHQGNELVVVDKSGNCTMIYGSGTSWTAERLWKDPGTPGLARLTAGEVDTSIPGKEIVVGGDSKNVGLLWREGETWKGKVIFTDTDSIRGVGISDVDPTQPGNEVLVFGYSFKVHLLTQKDGSWKSRVLFTDTGRSHDLAVGEVDPAHMGPEIIITGYSKNVTMLSVSPWYYKVLSSYTTKTSGCTFGDLDSTRAGNEIVTVNGDGLVSMVYLSQSGTWESIDLWQGQGELITPVIADFYPENPGNELVVVGMAIGPEADTGAGQATMIYGSGNTWKSAVIYLATNMLHGVAVGDLDPNHDGNEVITMSFGFDVDMLTWNGTAPTDWKITPMWKGQGKVRKGIIDDIDPKHQGNELVVVDKSGNCTMIYGTGTSWTAETLWKDPGTPGLARINAGEVDPTIPGKEIVVGGDSKNVGLLWREGETWKGKVIFTDTDAIRGIGIGDVDPTHTGNELVVFGYSKKVTLLTQDGENWKSKVIFTDTGRSHDLALGEFYSSHQGQELIITGYSKNITMIFNQGSTEKSDFNLYGYPLEQTISAGSSAFYNLGILAVGGFNQPVKFSVSGLPDGVSADFYPETVIPDSLTGLTIEIPVTKTSAENELKIKASGGGISHELNLKLNILGDTDPPNIARTFPENDAEEIPTNTPIVIWFSEAMDPATVTGNAVSIKTEDTGDVYTGTLEYEQSSNTLTISGIGQGTSGNGLPNSKVIKVTLTSTIQDLAGNALEKNYEFKFQVQKQDTPSSGNPNIKDVYPEFDDSAIPLKSPIVIQFTLPMDPETLNSNNIQILDSEGNQYIGTASYDQESLTLTINDIRSKDGTQIGFIKDEKIDVKLTTGIKTITGTPLANEYVWSFETGKGTGEDKDENGLSEELSTTALTVIAVLIIIIILMMLVLAVSKKSSEPSKIEKPVQKSKPKTKKSK